MTCRTPQHLADFLGLYLCRIGHVWYGCRTKPEWNGVRWDVDGAGVEVMLLWHDVMFVGSDYGSMTEPNGGDGYGL